MDVWSFIEKERMDPCAAVCDAARLQTDMFLRWFATWYTADRENLRDIWVRQGWNMGLYEKLLKRWPNPTVSAMLSNPATGHEFMIWNFRRFNSNPTDFDVELFDEPICVFNGTETSHSEWWLNVPTVSCMKDSVLSLRAKVQAACDFSKFPIELEELILDFLAPTCVY